MILILNDDQQQLKTSIFQFLGYIEEFKLRHYTTQTLRKYELGIFTIFTDSSSFSIALPPGLDKFNLKSSCYNTCLRQVR